MAALDDPDERVRWHAADALVVLPYLAAGHRLIACLDDDNRLVRLVAAKGVGRFVVTEARPALHKAIRSDDRWLSLRAAEALARIGDPSDQELIREAAARDRRRIFGGRRKKWNRVLADLGSP
jgi:HEAT repeat protein